MMGSLRRVGGGGGGGGGGRHGHCEGRLGKPTTLKKGNTPLHRNLEHLYRKIRIQRVFGETFSKSVRIPT
jgi:hypothetical protein